MSYYKRRKCKITKVCKNHIAEVYKYKGYMTKYKKPYDRTIKWHVHEIRENNRTRNRNNTLLTMINSNSNENVLVK